MAETSWNLPPPPGFQGLREDAPIHFYYRHLPHWRQAGATYFVTFRLADSLPQSKLRELRAIKAEWLRRHGVQPGSLDGKEAHFPISNEQVSQAEWEGLGRLILQKTEDWLDQGMGKCWMKQPPISRIVADALEYFDGSRYELGAYVVMPNHVHAIVRPFDSETDPLETILQSRKRHTASLINKAIGSRGTLWQDESFDRIIRDEEHLYRCLQYIGRNPERARLLPDAFRRWVNPTWIDLGWDFEK